MGRGAGSDHASVNVLYGDRQARRVNPHQVHAGSSDRDLLSAFTTLAPTQRYEDMVPCGALNSHWTEDEALMDQVTILLDATSFQSTGDSTGPRNKVHYHVAASRDENGQPLFLSYSVQSTGDDHVAYVDQASANLDDVLEQLERELKDMSADKTYRRVNGSVRKRFTREDVIAAGQALLTAQS